MSAIVLQAEDIMLSAKANKIFAAFRYPQFLDIPSIETETRAQELIEKLGKIIETRTAAKKVPKKKQYEYHLLNSFSNLKSDVNDDQVSICSHCLIRFNCHTTFCNCNVVLGHVRIHYIYYHFKGFVFSRAVMSGWPDSGKKKKHTHTYTQNSRDSRPPRFQLFFTAVAKLQQQRLDKNINETREKIGHLYDGWTKDEGLH